MKPISLNLAKKLSEAARGYELPRSEYSYGEMPITPPEALENLYLYLITNKLI